MADRQIPRNADEILYVEDLVNCVLRRHSVVELPCTAEPFRNYVQNRFNDTSRMAINSIYNEMSRNCYDDIEEVNNESFVRFASQIKLKYFPVRFDGNNFFRYCVHMSIVAAEFCRRGYPHGPKRAVIYIRRSLENFDVANGGWETLNRCAENYANYQRIIFDDKMKLN